MGYTAAKSLFSLVIFGLVYLIILTGEKAPRKLDRTAAGLIGGVLMVLCGVLTRRQALAAIDFPTIVLLLGMMILIHYATVSGLLEMLANRFVGNGNSPEKMLWTVCFVSGVLSTLFVNDTICLLMTPLLLTATRRARFAAEPYLLMLATSSNVGSVMTLTGNPQNILIGQSSGWTWGAYALRMVPVGVVCLAINAVVVNLLYRGRLRAEKKDGSAPCVVAPKTEPERENPAVKPDVEWESAAGAKPAYQSARPGAVSDAPNAAAETKRVLDRPLATKTIVVLVGLLVAFLAGAPMDLAALTAAGVLLVLANLPSEVTLASVDWSLLLFFAGLFVVVEGVTKTQGHWIARLLPGVTQYSDSLVQLAKFSGASVLGSNLFSNVPFVMLIRGWIGGVPHARLLWLMLAASSTLAGNLTLVGSVANLIVAQRASPECRLSFTAFLRVGVVTTLLTTAASIVILWFYGRLGWA